MGESFNNNNLPEANNRPNTVIYETNLPIKKEECCDEDDVLLGEIKLEIKEEVLDEEDLEEGDKKRQPDTPASEERPGSGQDELEEEGESSSDEEEEGEEDEDEIEFDSTRFKEETSISPDKTASLEQDAGSRSCPHCPKTFQYPSALKRHLVKHTSERNFKCHLCPKAFGTNNHLHRHYRGVHKVEPPPKPRPSVHVCPICRKELPTAGKLRRHTVFKHTKEKSHKCNLCSEYFYSNSHLQRHLRSHLQEKPFGCTVCGRRFLEKFNLTAHLRIHNNEYPYECPQCERKFRASNTLRQHVMIHTGEKRHECDVCQMKFIAKSTLTRHRMTHTKERPFSCSECGKGFATGPHVRRHYRSVHKDKEANVTRVEHGGKNGTNSSLLTDATSEEVQIKRNSL